MIQAPPPPYRWFSRGDLGAFFALMPDNMATLAIMTAILLGFGVPADIVFGRMVPGTALGVLAGDLLYTWMAIRLARRSGNPATCAIPLGLDTPSTIGIVVCVLGPVFLEAKARGLSPVAAGAEALNIGVATMLLIGLFKLALSFCGGWIRRQVPAAALLGSLAGVGIALLGFMQLANLFTVPVAGMVSLAILFFSLLGRMRLPRGFPGVLAAILAGAAIFHGMGAADWNPGDYAPPPLHFYLHLPLPSLSGVAQLDDAFRHLSVSIPFAILTVVGGINVSASAHALGDAYRTRSVLMTEAFSTILAGLFGGVAQTTPYAGFPAYKAMGARAGYTLAVGLFIGLGGILGYVSFIVELIPASVLAPILIFLGIEVVAQPYLDCPRRHAAAVGLAILPGLARLLAIYLSNAAILPPEALDRLLSEPSGAGFPPVLIVFVLGNGFILTGMLWGAFMAEMIDRRFGRACAALLICAALSLFGIIHSPFAGGEMFWPWRIEGLPRQVALQFSAAYLLTAALLFLLARRSTPEPDAS